MKPEDYQRLDDIIYNNKRFFIAQPFDRYLDGNLRDSLNEFIHDYKAEEIDPNLDNDVYDREENIIYKIFWQLIPFLKKKYYNKLYDNYMEYHKQRGNINESQYERLFTDLPPFLKRRITLDDLKYFDDNITSYILSTPPTDDFKDFSSVVVGDLLHDFILERKGDEIETEIEPDYGVVYKAESRDKIMGMYWDLKPILIKKYKDRLYQAWERKKSL